MATYTRGGDGFGLVERMPFAAKALVPSGSDQDALHTAFEDAAAGGVTVLGAPSSYMLTEGLASALTRMGRHPLWLRLGPEDRDPATFLVSLAAAAQRRQGGVGQVTLQLMRSRPGPAFGWSPLFAALAHELRNGMAQGGALVLEDAHYVSTGCPTLALVGADLFPEFDGTAPCVILAHSAPPSPVTWKCARLSASDLRLPPQKVEQVLDEYAPALTKRARNRAVALIGGRAAVLAGLRSVHTAAGGSLETMLDRATNCEELLAQLARALLADVDGEACRALALATRIGYAHQHGTAAIAAGNQIPAGPWFQCLEDGWMRVRACWREPLRAVLGVHAKPSGDTLHDAAEWLIRSGGNEQAISLYLEIGDSDCAARVMASNATMLMDLGQWATLESWLRQVPDDALSPYPYLMYCKAAIAAAHGNAATAQRWFRTAAAHCSIRKDAEGACRSRLAASVTAADHGDLMEALADASAAESLAEGSNLTSVQMWASWQQGRLQLIMGDTDAALASFCRAASCVSTSGEGTGAQSVGLTGMLAMRIAELRKQQESHREAQAALKQAEHEALNQLLANVRTPTEGSDVVLGTYGWTRAPAPLKRPGLSTPSIPTRTRRAWLLARLRRPLQPNRQTDPARPAQFARSRGYFSAAEPAPVADPLAVPRSPVARHPPGIPYPSATPEPPAPLAPSLAKRHDTLAELAVHLLGRFCAAVDNVSVVDWPSARCRSLFAYLLTHREPWPAREVLMEVFWPESAPEASRNSLNVAIHGLRRTLRTVTALPVILHISGAYGIHPDLQLWLDVEQFESRLACGRRCEEAGNADRAAREYESADGLYRGDFLADDLYEEWASLTRERLRLAYLDALSRLSNFQFGARRYAACAALCQRIIECDPCREDAHRRLMRCYSRQGQPHLALLQYRACVRALADELGVAADPATTSLCDQIRRHEPV